MALGEDAVSSMLTKGAEELRAANAGQMAMDAPPVEPPQASAPAAEPSGYEAALSQAAQVAQSRAPEPSMGMER